jgi:hypothetical protein
MCEIYVMQLMVDCMNRVLLLVHLLKDIYIIYHNKCDLQSTGVKFLTAASKMQFHLYNYTLFIYLTHFSHMQ